MSTVRFMRVSAIWAVCVVLACALGALAVCSGQAYAEVLYRHSTVSYLEDGGAKYIQSIEADGVPLTEGVDYTLTYSNNMRVGTATVVVTAMGQYSGTEAVNFPVTVKPTYFSMKTTPKRGKKLKVVWEKQAAKYVSGYEVQIATDKKFKKGKKKATIKKASTASKTFTKLKKGKKYYLRIRTYKTINGVKNYSKWETNRTLGRIV